MQAFQNLVSLDRRCRENAVGLPRVKAVSADWIGLGFQLQSQACLARMGQVTEILPVPTSIRVPGVKPWVLGLANVRGNLMPIIDLNHLTGGEATTRSSDNRVLVLHKDQSHTALLVSEVYGLRRFREEQISAERQLLSLPDWQGIFSGCMQDEQNDWQIVDLHACVDSEAFLKVI